MNFYLTKIICFSFCLIGLTNVNANSVLVSTNKPAQITFQIAHKNAGNKTIYSESKNIWVKNNVTVSFGLEGYQLSGIVIKAINGHQLPRYVSRFNHPRNCSMTTDKLRATGALTFKLSPHTLKCSTFGGIFG